MNFRYFVLVVLLVVATCRSVARGKPQPAAQSCGTEPKLLPKHDAKVIACWDDAVGQPGSISYEPIQLEQRVSATAASWAELQTLIDAAEGPAVISLPGTHVATKPVVISRTSQLKIIGPAKVTCSGASSTAFVISRYGQQLLCMLASQWMMQQLGL
jgi:hypothetical protein